MDIIDQKITFFIISLLPHNQFFDQFFSFFSIRGMSVIIWVVITLLVIFLEEKKHPGISKKDKQFIITLFFSLLTTFITTNFILKPLFHRPRPVNFFQSQKENWQLLNRCPIDYSLPSSHAATAFAAATILVFFDKKRNWFYWLLAFLISLSRIYLNCHYFFDVAFGAVIGYLISKLIILSSLRQPKINRSG